MEGRKATAAVEAAAATNLLRDTVVYMDSFAGIRTWQWAVFELFISQLIVYWITSADGIKLLWQPKIQIQIQGLSLRLP
jgi:hypothetical protein